MLLHPKAQNELIYTVGQNEDFDLILIEENLSNDGTEFVKILLQEGFDPNLELLNPLTEKHIVNLMMYGNKNRIQTLGLPAPTRSNVKLSSIFYDDRNELLTDVKSTTEKHYNSKWKDHLPASYLQFMDEILFSVIQPENSLKITNDNQLAVTVCLFDVKSALLEPFRCIGWIWIADDLPSTEKQAVHFEVSTWLKEQETNLAASIFVKNERAIAFHRKLGLSPKWIRIGKV
ncbi:MAG: hypothetical protein H7235_10020 [Bdellovibrionaceae bacterium]|nr:hypothetical protein [Pseudobdellovibrionaceae bacterium]